MQFPKNILAQQVANGLHNGPTKIFPNWVGLIHYDSLSIFLSMYKNFLNKLNNINYAMNQAKE